jgi:hypothetical protein
MFYDESDGHFKMRIHIAAINAYIKQVAINIVTWTKKITSLFIYLFFHFSSKKKKKKKKKTKDMHVQCLKYWWINLPCLDLFFCWVDKTQLMPKTGSAHIV